MRSKPAGSSARAMAPPAQALPVEPVWAVTPEKIQAAVDRLAAAAPSARILLFGSAARDETTRDSDADFLVVTREELESPRLESIRLRRALRGISMPMDVLVVSEERLARLSAQVGTVYRQALREGKWVYESPT